jgi:hypothetical protein
MQIFFQSPDYKILHQIWVTLFFTFYLKLTDSLDLSKIFTKLVGGLLEGKVTHNQEVSING